MTKNNNIIHNKNGEDYENKIRLCVNFIRFKYYGI